MEVPDTSQSHTQNTTLVVKEIDCASEVATVEQALRGLPGVTSVKANLLSKTVSVAHDITVLPNLLIRTLKDAGLTATEKDNKSIAQANPERDSRLLSVLISGATSAVGIATSFFVESPIVYSCYLIAIISGGWFIFPKAKAALLRLQPDMNLLMTVAVFGALLIGEWSEAAAVTFLFALSEWLESFSVARARKAIESLLNLAPETALLKVENEFREVPVSDVVVGATLLIRSGARIPLDGEVNSGSSAVNQAPITGESMPVEKKVGDHVFAGTMNGEGSLEIRTTTLASDTMLARIIHLVEEAQGEKAPSQRFVDQFTKYYTPTVMVGAVLAFVVPPLFFGAPWVQSLYRSLVLLVIACPCALVISTPVAIVSGLTAMARRGVLVKGGAYLESIGKLKALAVDKTGTITEGVPKVVAVTAWGASTEEEVIRVAAAIDAHSDHPLARAVTRYAEYKNIVVPQATDYQSVTGKGAKASLDGTQCFVGNHRFSHELGVCAPELEKFLSSIEEKALSVVVVGHTSDEGRDGKVLGVLAVGDAIRANAAEAIRALHSAGISKVVMLSGDNQRTVSAIAKQVGIDEARGDLLPEQKIEHVRELMQQHKYVGMIGDGVNDAPAMALATVGIAMGVAGTDTAIETADIALMQDDLLQVAGAVALGKRTARIIRVNIVFSLVVKGIFLVLALFGWSTLWLAILADTGATIAVVANSLRLLRNYS